MKEIFWVSVIVLMAITVSNVPPKLADLIDQTKRETNEMKAARADKELIEAIIKSNNWKPIQIK